MSPSCVRAGFYVIEDNEHEIGKVAAGWEHSLVLKRDGTVWAMGSNHKGQLGDGSTEDKNTLAMVIGTWG